MKRSSTPAVVRRYWQAVASRDIAAVGGLLTPDFVEEWPQSGELIRGADAWRRLVERHPTYPAVRLRRTRGSGSLFVCEADFDYGDGDPWRICSILELRGDRIAHITQYFGAPFPRAEWRADIVERSTTD